MNILILIKYSRDVSELRVDPETREIRLEGVPLRIGGIDKGVVEAAVRLRAENGGTVRALCLGPLAARDGFRDVLAMGVDGVTLIEDPFDGAEPVEVVVRILEAAIRGCVPYDLVLCGFASDDGYTFQVGPRLAERLGLPLVSYARALALTNGTLTADRDLENAVQTVSVTLPAVVSVAEEAFQPRRITLMDALRSKQKPVHVWHVDEELGLSRETLEAAGHVLSSTLSGVLTERRRRVLRGTGPHELADDLIDFLVEEHVLQARTR